MNRLSYFSREFEQTAIPNIYRHKPTSCYCFYAQGMGWAVCGIGSLSLYLHDSIDAAKQAEEIFYNTPFWGAKPYAH